MLSISIASVNWALFRSSGVRNKFNLDCILRKVYQLFKSIDQFRYLEMEDLPQEFWIEKSSL